MVGVFVNAEIEKSWTMISEKRASDILEKTSKYLQLNTPPLHSGLSAGISIRREKSLSELGEKT